jgi:hypothetical protein
MSPAVAQSRGPLPCACQITAGRREVLAVERRVRHPNIDLTLLHNRILSAALLSLTLAMLALFAVSFSLSFYFEALRGFSIATSAFLLTPLPAPHSLP